AMQRALDDAGIGGGEVDYINAHGTGTYLNDHIETVAIKLVFGARAHAIPVSSTKSIVGHTAGASAALEAAICCLAVRRGVGPPALHYDTPRPGGDLDYGPNARRRQGMGTALRNSLAVGGENPGLRLRRGVWGGRGRGGEEQGAGAYLRERDPALQGARVRRGDDRRHRRAAGDQPGDVLQLLSEQGRDPPPGCRGHRGAVSGHARARGGKRHPHGGED